jgi:hypothetical protein
MRAFRRTVLVGAGAIGAAAAIVAPAVASDPDTAPAAPPGMARTHELMSQGNPGMARTHELMSQGNPGMERMHELMMRGAPRRRVGRRGPRGPGGRRHDQAHLGRGHWGVA